MFTEMYEFLSYESMPHPPPAALATFLNDKSLLYFPIASVRKQNVRLSPTNSMITADVSRGTSPYYLVELLKHRHSMALGFCWFVSFGVFCALLAQSNEMQYDCYSFCDTVVGRSCSLLHSSNGSDVSWRAAASSCFNPVTTNMWSSQGSISLVPPVSAQDVIPDMSSRGRRFNRLILRFGSDDYRVSPLGLVPQVLSMRRVDGGAVLPAPVVLGSVTPERVFDLELSSQDGNAAIIFDLPIGYVFPPGTQQMALFFANGSPLIPLWNSSASGMTHGPVQLTFASSSPAYVFTEAIIRYVLLVCSAVVAAVVLCLHALADTDVYPVQDPTVPCPSRWNPLSWLRVVRRVWRSESFGTVWARQSTVVQTQMVLLAALVVLCDPLAAAFAAAPDSLFLQFWTLHLMPWLRFTWLVCAGVFFVALLITSGSHGAMLVPKSSAYWQRNGALPSSKRTWKWFAALGFAMPCLYFCSVLAASIKGQPSAPAALGVADGSAMFGSLIGMELWFPVMFIGYYRYHRRVLYAKFPAGIDDRHSIPIFGTPDAPLSGRVMMTTTRFLVPYCVWASVFMCGLYFGILIGISTLLPSYSNGYLVEVMMTVLLGWTVAIVSIPVRLPMSTYPPRPSLILSATSSTASSSPRGQQQHHTASTTETPLLLGAHPPPSHLTTTTEGHAETKSIMLPLWCQLSWTSSYFANLRSGRVPNIGYTFQTEAQQAAFDSLQQGGPAAPSDDGWSATPSTCPPADPWRRSFFCWETAVRCLNMSNEAYNEVDGEKDLSHFSKAEEYEQSGCESCIINRCCCCFFGGCRGSCCLFGCGGDDDDEDVAAVDITEHASTAVGGAHDEDYEGGDAHALRMSKSSRRFTEAGAVADASRQSVANRLRSESLAGGPNHASDVSTPMQRQETASPPTSPTADKQRNEMTSGGRSPTKSCSPPAPPALEQIDVTKYGYDLLKVLDIYGVRVIVAATPPGTTGRHPHLCIAFRGTVNLRNALTDANARMVEHPEMPPGSQVHRGFWHAFKEIVPSLVAVLRDFFLCSTENHSSAREAWASSLSSIVCTGHSLGGALAMLCAYSISAGSLNRDVFGQQSNARRRQVVCYTYGSPRLGNVHLAQAYNSAVPETYRTINENDLVARVGLCWQEHAGREVRINRDGDVVVEGTWLEKEYVLTSGVGSSIKNHFLLRYGNSIDNCLCGRNLNVLSPDCCSFLMVHLEEKAEHKEV